VGKPVPWCSSGEKDDVSPDDVSGEEDDVSPNDGKSDDKGGFSKPEEIGGNAVSAGVGGRGSMGDGGWSVQIGRHSPVKRRELNNTNRFS